jgi:hypothetical protein
LTFRQLQRAAASIVLTAGISLPVWHGVAHAALDDSDEDVTATSSFADGPVAQDLISDFVPTSTNVADCPAGTYNLLYQGDPVVDANGNPVCVTEDAGGGAGSTIPGQPGQNGGDSNSEGDTTYGQLGEVPAP